MTTKDIIKILPFDEAFKTQLLGQYDTLDEDRKSVIVDMLWDAYGMLYDVKLQENMQIALAKADKGEQELDSTFYAKMVEQTEKEMQELSIEAVEGADLGAARTAMENIIKEIRAAKTAKKS